ncbi:MAG: precorrin-8X methylmutase, partial [Nodosilinea sp.]
RYPEGIFVIGASEAALATLVDLIEAEQVRPALVVATPAGFIDTAIIKDRLQDTMVPHVSIGGRKGSAVVAAAIVNGLVDLAWQAYGKDSP